MNISITQKVEVAAHATTFNDKGPYWSAALYVDRVLIAEVGVNAQGRYTTRKAAIRAAINKARSYGHQLTVHRS